MTHNISVINMSFSYKNQEVFQSFSFESSSDFIVFHGPSGCGKTTLLKILTGFLSPQSGSVETNCRKISMVIQEDSLFPWMSGVNNICKVLSVGREKVIEHPMYENVKNFIYKKAYSMSYGQRRLVELLRVLVYRPDMACLDEPFNFLDDNYRQLVITHLKELKKTGTKIIMSTHADDDLTLSNNEVYVFGGKLPQTEITRSHV